MQANVQAMATARAAYLAAQAQRVRRGASWRPQPGPQTDAYLSAADEIYYGGAAGGGKTDLELGYCFTLGWRSIVFRREYPMLKDIIERGKELVGPKYYNANDHVFALPDGRTVQLGAMQYEDDKKNWQGRPKDTYCFDEAPQFTLSQILFVTNWLRTTRKGQRTRVILAGNPPLNPDEQWIVERYAPWLDAHNHMFGQIQPGELLWCAMVNDEEVIRPDGEPFEHEGEIITPLSRTFIPASLSDNIYITPEYRARLQAAPEPLRSQLLYGRMDLQQEDNPWQVIPTDWVRQAQRRWQERERPETPMTCLGVDVARGGKDKTVLAARYDNWFAPLTKMAGKDTPNGPTVAAAVMSAISDEPAHVNIDAIGVGTSPLDILSGNKITVYAINNAESADVKDWSGKVIEQARDKSKKYKFRNVRAASYWRLREALDPQSGEEIALPPDTELLADICAARWGLSASGIMVESKEDIKKRLGRSPDCADAVVLAHYRPGKPPELTVTETERGIFSTIGQSRGI
jgi:hypothetical protein